MEFYNVSVNLPQGQNRNLRVEAWDRSQAIGIAFNRLSDEGYEVEYKDLMRAVPEVAR